MPDLVVRFVDEAVVKALRERAGAHGRSAEAEHRKILEEVLLYPGKYRAAQAAAAAPAKAVSAAGAAELDFDKIVPVTSQQTKPQLDSDFDDLIK